MSEIADEAESGRCREGARVGMLVCWKFSVSLSLSHTFAYDSPRNPENTIFSSDFIAQGADAPGGRP